MVIDVAEMGIGEMLEALEQGRISSVDLVCAYLNRIGYFDRTGVCLNAVPILNPDVIEEARASDARRRAGTAGPLEGIPFTVKDSYMVAGLTVASGSPAFEGLVASRDAATVAKLREAGAEAIAGKVLAETPVAGVRVRVRKPSPPIRGAVLDSASVTIHRAKSPPPPMDEL